MKKVLLLIVISLLMHFCSTAQYVELSPDGIQSWLQERYPSCFVNGMLDTTCSEITSEDSLTISLGRQGNYINLDGLQYFTSLVYLDISQNGITEYYFPPNVQTIDCSSSMADQPYGILTGVPASVTKLIFKNNNAVSVNIPPNLRYLDISGNSFRNLDSLPNTLDTLICPSQYYYGPYTPCLGRLGTLPANLRYLDCSGNVISSLGTLPSSLRYLNCSNQNYHTNPESIAFVLDSLPSVLPPSLEYLYCSSNKLTFIPALPPTLKVLDCSHNRIFDTEIMGTGGTGELMYEGISSLPPLPAGLLELVITGNNFTNLPHPLPAGLTKLYVGSNVKTNYGDPVTVGIQCLPILPASLTELYCARTLINCVPNSGAYTMNPVLPLCTQPCQADPLMQGYVFYDNNSNGLKDAGENFRSNVETVSGSGSYAYSNNEGFFELTGQVGPSMVTINSPRYYQAVPVSQVYDFTNYSYDTVVSKVYALQPTQSVDSISVSIIPLSTARPGFTNNYLINYEDVGTTTVSVDIQFRYDASRMTYASSSVAGISNSNGVLSIPAVNLTPGDRGNFRLTFNVIPSAHLGDTIRVSLRASYNSSNSTDSTYSVIRGSFDPNDKRATPSLTPTQVNNGAYIDYLVRFQNTGTDTAFNVLLKDQLDTLLNASSFQVIAASHPAKIQRTGNAVTFEFTNIHLPDSNVNEPASHGYIRFRVKPQLRVTTGDVIPNSANIYFDFNSPVLTNTSQTTIVPDIVIVVTFRLDTIFAMTDQLNNAILSWTTEHEINTASFEIERSNDGLNFARIGTIPAIGSGGHDYQFPSPMRNSIEYFRLKILDADGRYEYSQVVHTEMNDRQNSLQILGNPVKGKLSLQLYDGSLVGTKAYVIDNLGRKVVAFSLQMGRQDIELRGLQHGVYFLIAGKEKRKFVLMK